MDGRNEEGDGGEKSGREGEGVSEKGRKVYFNQGRREGEGVCNLFQYMYVCQKTFQQSKVALNQAECVHVFCTRYLIPVPPFS